MQLNREITNLTEQDAGISRALLALIRQGDFDLKGESVVRAGALFSWLESLDARIMKTISPPAPLKAKEIKK